MRPLGVIDMSGIDMTEAEAEAGLKSNAIHTRQNSEIESTRVNAEPAAVLRAKLQLADDLAESNL